MRISNLLSRSVVYQTTTSTTALLRCPRLYQQSFHSSFSSGSDGARPEKSAPADNAVMMGHADPTRQRVEDHRHCVEMVRDRDRDGYLCGLLMPNRAKEAYFAIRALNVELASIKDQHHVRRSSLAIPALERTSVHVDRSSSKALPTFNDQVSSPPTTLALRIRMQWWRDAIRSIYEESTLQKQHQALKRSPALHGASPSTIMAMSSSISCWHNPVVRSLHRARQSLPLTRRFLDRLVDARESDLDIHQYDTLHQAMQYAEDSTSSLLYLALECSGVQEDAADEVAFHAGVGIGLVTAIRATPFRLAHGEIALPAELFPSDYSCDQLLRRTAHRAMGSDSALDEHDSAVIREVVQKVAHTAVHQLSRAQEIQGQVPSHAKASLLPMVPALHYLSMLEKSNYDVFHTQLSQPARPSTRLMLLLLMGRAWLSGIY